MLRVAIISSILTILLLLAALLIWGVIAGKRGKGPVQIKRDRRGGVDLHITLPVPRLLAGTPEPNRIIYLNREGATLRGGDDDATRNRSSIAGRRESDLLRIPAFAGSPQRWRAIVECVRAKLAPFDVEVVDQRPIDQPHLMVVIGGRANLLPDRKSRRHRHATGLAPYSGRVIPNAVVLVFARALREHTRKVCETAGMEIAHAYGLDHTHHCRDLMTYLPYCGPKRYLDRDLPCGEYKKRSCQPHGNATQNSFQHLKKVLGLRTKSSTPTKRFRR